MTLEAETDFVDIPLDELKIYFPKKEAVYKLLEREGYDYILPSLNSTGVTVQYLLDLASEKIYGLKKENFKKAPELKDKSLTVEDLLKLLSKIVKKDLGFDFHRLPNKEWVLNCIYSENPKNDIFLRSDQTLVHAVPRKYFKYTLGKNEARRSLL